MTQSNRCRVGMSVALTMGIVAMVLAQLWAQQKPAASAEALMGTAQYQEEVEGKPEAAIVTYRKVLTTPGVPRALAARALLRMGQCHERLGQADARKAYERLVREFADQQESVVEARARLAALAEPAGAKNPGLSVRQVWAGPNVDTTGSPSADGRLLAVTDPQTGDVAVRDLTTGEVRRVTKSGPAGEHAYIATFSPDGKHIAYGWFDSKNRVYDARLIGVDGTDARTLYHDNAAYVFPVGWTGDGMHVAVVVDYWGKGDRVKQIGLVSVADGTLRVLKTLAVDGLRDRVSTSPDGRYLVYDVPQRNGKKDIFLVSVRDGRENRLVEGPANDAMPIWTPDGRRVLFMSDRAGSTGLWMLEVVDGRAASPPELVKRDIGAGFVPMGFTRSGSLYYGVDTGMVDVYVATIDPNTGRVLEAPAPIGSQGVGANRAPCWSPDGKYLAYLSGRGPAAGTTITVRELETGKERDLSVSVAGVRRLRWLPTATALLFAGIDSQQQSGIYRLDLQSGALSTFVRGEADLSFGLVSVTSDGKTLVYTSSHLQTGTRTVVARDLQADQEKGITLSLSPSGMAVSPDGSRIAIWTVKPGGRTAILVMPASGGEPREVCGFERPAVISGQPEWTPDGRYLLFPAMPQEKTVLMAVPSEGGEPRSFAFDLEGVRETSVHPDGTRVAFAAGQAKSEVWVIEHFLPPSKVAAKLPASK